VKIFRRQKTDEVNSSFRSKTSRPNAAKILYDTTDEDQTHRPFHFSAVPRAKPNRSREKSPKITHRPCSKCHPAPQLGQVLARQNKNNNNPNFSARARRRRATKK
jgi:hypothetical protein